VAKLTLLFYLRSGLIFLVQFELPWGIVEYHEYKMTLNNEPRLEKAFWLSLYCLAFLFPFSHLGGKIFILIGSLIWILQGKYRNIKNEYFYYLLIFSAYYFINLIGLIHSDNISTALTRLDSRLSYLIFPLLIFTTPYNHNRYNIIFWCFTFSIIGVSLVCICLAVINILPLALLPNINKLSYVHLTDPLDLHPTYFSICISIVIFFILTKIKSTESKITVIIFIIVILYLTGFLFLLLSRGVIIPFILAITFSGLLFLLQTKNKKLLLILCSMLILAFGSIFFIDVMKERFIAPFMSGQTVISDNQQESVALHLKSWYCACELLSDFHIFTGYGSGDEKEVLAACYESHGWGIMVSERYNAHNEYLSCLLRNGITEVLVLLASLFTSLYWSLKGRNLLYVSFSTVFILALLFTTLNDFSAIVAFTFFNALLFVTAKNTQSIPSKALK
jgi:O-antigen ligase